MNTIQSQWESFLKDVVPEDAEQVQITETQKAFYGGVSSLMGLMIGLADLSEDASNAIMDNWLQEIDDYIKNQGDS